MLDDLQKKIESDKEILTILPQNNLKNKKAYKQKVEELITYYKDIKETTLKEIEYRVERLKAFRIDPEIESLKNEIGSIESNMYLFNEYKDAMAKSGLDVLLYNLSSSTINLTNLNECIVKIIDCFKEVGIFVTSTDFSNSIFAYEYMKEFFLKLEENDLESLTEIFERIYWKCPEIITNLKLCFLLLYYKNAKKFDKYFLEQKENYHLNIDYYNELLKKYNQKINNDLSLILAKFLKKELNPKDFQEEKISKFLIELNILDSNAYNNLLKLSYSLDEYKNYLKYKYLIDELKVLYKDKQSYKNIAIKTLKTIIKKEKLLNKYSKKLFKLYNKNKEVKIDLIMVSFNNLIKEIDTLYLELEDSKIKEAIFDKFVDSTTMLEALMIIYSHFSYFAKIVKKNNEVDDEEIGKIRHDLFKFITSPYNTIINNTPFLFEDNVADLIKDKYNLIDVNLKEENLEESSLDNFILNVNNSLISFTIKNSIIDVADIAFLVDAENIIDKGETP